MFRTPYIALKNVDVFNPKSGRQTGEKKIKRKKANDNTVV